MKIVYKLLQFTLLLMIFSSCSSKDWRSASRESANIATPAKEQKEDIFQIYYARAFAWRGYFGTHPWVAWKLKEDTAYTVAQVTSWNIRATGSAINVEKQLPDRKWYDNEPTLLFESTGGDARLIVAEVKKLIKQYPFKDRYVLWPGPNSNTFVSYLIRNIKEIDTELPANAIGKDYLGPNTFWGESQSNTGYQLSFFGLFGATAAKNEGIEINLLGLNFGIDFWRPALKLPFIGRLGFSESVKK
ncbi:DUF3750 domain-containing protein [Bacteriovorax sp. Seq25_V]|uniref:DUF3750 domain-containing protein n=1 Tax=Bacteriovorax sp. Seq25_V TaxID=1201288 RepID=UPI00038A5600|nr:DUF3750 domain-containing protein [Bacteriovorax sp. Seq25_V]EQC43983.1 PF12570 family protein [Bacteriovorax sp. Seq25_V]